jgi:acyl-CoA synthetase (NDP forming)
VLDVIASDPGVGTVFFQAGPMSRGDAELAETIVAFRTRCPKPALVAWPLAIDAARDAFRAGSMHLFPEYSRGVRTIGRLAAYFEDLASTGERPEPATFDWSAFVPAPEPGEVVTEDRCHRLLADAGMSVAPGRLAHTEDEAVQIADEVGMPAAMKGISRQLTHRAAAGLLALSLRTEADIRDAWGRIMARAQSRSVTLDGVYVQKMAPDGDELLLSAHRDPNFGVMVSIGAGGVMTELIDDVILMSAPISAIAAARALNRLRVVRRAGGVTADQALSRCVARFAGLAAAAPWRGFVLELNPVKWTPSEAVAVDGLLIISEP